VTREELRAHVGAVMELFEDAAVFGPGVTVDVPAPSSDPNEPSSFVTWSLEDEQREPLTMGGDWTGHGGVSVVIWTEKDFGDDLALEHADTIGSLFRAADGDGLHFVALDESPGELEGDSFVGREYLWTYRRVE